MSNEILPILLDETKAYWVDSASMGLLPDKSLVREWRNVPVEHRDACLISLRAVRSHTDPKTQTKVHAGKYRVQKVEDIIPKDSAGRVGGITIRETLAFGLATTLAEAGQLAKLTDAKYLPSAVKTQAISPAHTATASVEQDYKQITLKWDNLDPASLNGIVASRTTLSESAITVGGESLTGPWYILTRKPSWAEDGSGVYEETWGLAGWYFEASGKRGNVETSAAVYIQAVPKDRVQTVLAAELAKVSSTYGNAGLVYEQKIYWREDTADIMIDAVQDNQVTDAHTAEKDYGKTVVRDVFRNAAALPDVADPVQGVVGIVSGSINSSGKVDYTKEVNTATKKEVTQFDSEVSFAKTEKTKAGDNLYDADVGAYGITQVQGKTFRRSHTKQDDGTYQDVVVEVASISQTASIDGTHHDQYLDADDRTESTVRATAATVPLADVPFATQGTIVETENFPNEDGTYRTEAKTVVSKEQEILDVTLSEDKFKKVESDIGKQIKDVNLLAHFPMTVTTGEVHSRRISENSDGTFDVTRDRDVAKTVASVQTASEIQAFETIAVDVDKNNVAGDTPPVSQTAGIIKRVTNKVNEYDRVDVEVETRTATAVTAAQRNTEARAFDKTDAVTDRNQVAIATPQTAQTAGTIISARGELNEFGKYDNVIDTKTAIAVSTSEKETTARAFDKSETITDRNQTAITTEQTTQTAGTIITAKGSLNEFGRYDNTVDTKTSIVKTSAVSETSTTAFDVSSRVTDRNEVAVETPIAAHVPGVLKTVRGELNEFGRYDNVIDTKTATVVSNAGRIAVAADDSVSITDISKNVVSEPASLTTAVAGTVKNQAKRLNDFGAWDVESTTDTRTDQSIAAPATVTDVGNVSYSPLVTSLTKVIDGQALNTDLKLGVGEYGTVSFRKDKYGRYVGEKTITTYNDSITIPGWALSSTSRSVSHTIRTTYKGKGYKRNIAYTIYETQTSSASTAIAFAGSVFSPGTPRTALVGTEAGSSAYHPLANGQYYAIRIEADDAHTTAWESETDGDFP